METKNIKCPSCGVVLSVKNSKDEAVKLITCPQCKATLSVRFKPQKPLEANTHLANGQQQAGGETQYGPSANQGETQLADGFTDHGETQQRTHHMVAETACLEVDGRTYQLYEGVNTVGRKALSSQASVQIVTADHYMSRQHAKIVVTRLAGGKLKAVISNDRNKNISTIDGQDLLQGDAIVLSDGDRIVMGKTTVIYREK